MDRLQYYLETVAIIVEILQLRYGTRITLERALRMADDMLGITN